MKLTSTAFQDGAEIPRTYAHEGRDISPPLSWTDVPAGARSLALIVEDPDAPDPAHPLRTWTHWVVFDLPPDAAGLPEGAGDLAPRHLGLNDWKQQGWGGPAPPIGRHRYFFKLFALDRELGLDRPTKKELEQAIGRATVLAQAQLVGTYQQVKAA